MRVAPKGWVTESLMRKLSRQEVAVLRNELMECPGVPGRALQSPSFTLPGRSCCFITVNFLRGI